jgi:HSP20 family protein
MQLTRWNPRTRVLRRQNDISRLFDTFFSPTFFPESDMEQLLTPAVDIFERDDKIVLNAELPGMKKDDINVDVKGKVLTLSGERENEKEEKEGSTFRKERRFGKFKRSFTLGFDINPEDVVAQYDNGVLTLEVSKPQEQQKKQITIN